MTYTPFTSCVDDAVSQDKTTRGANQVSGSKLFHDVGVLTQALRADEADGKIRCIRLLDLLLHLVVRVERKDLLESHVSRGRVGWRRWFATLVWSRRESQAVKVLIPLLNREIRGLSVGVDCQTWPCAEKECGSESKGSKGWTRRWWFSVRSDKGGSVQLLITLSSSLTSLSLCFCLVRRDARTHTLECPQTMTCSLFCTPIVKRHLENLAPVLPPLFHLPQPQPQMTRKRTSGVE